MKYFQAKRGFTMIEVLVVISIIGILSAVLYANFSSARQSAQNKALMTEVKEMQLAIEVYRAQNDRYPEPAPTAGCGSGSIVRSANTDDCGTSPYIAGLVPNFISSLPLASGSPNSNCNIEYVTNANGTYYKLTAENCLGGVTNLTGLNQDDDLARCPASCSATTYSHCDPSNAVFYESFAVYSSGGECT